MESPIRVQADLTEGITAFLRLVPDGMRAVGERLTEEYDYRRDSRRMRNITTAAALAVPDMGKDATAPDDDWLTEWFDLASKRSHPDWQKAMAKMLTYESNAPNSVPLRYFTDMARLDKDVIDEFKKYCGYYVDEIDNIVKNDGAIPRFIAEANLVTRTSLGVDLHLRQSGNEPLPVRAAGEIIRIKNGEYRLPVGTIRLTNFGQFVYSLLDPKPPPAPGLADSLRALWKDHLYEGNPAE